MHKLQDFFLFCSGANRTILNKTPSEQIKYTGIGATVFFTGLFAAISGAYALYFIFNDVDLVIRIMSAILFGLIWGAMIFNLDRYIVSSMKKKGSFLSELKLASPRILLAALIAFVISKPLELQIFHTSIEYELELMKQNDIKVQENALASRYAADISSITSQINLLKKEVADQTMRRDQLDEIARTEADGSGGSKKRGAATIYNLKKQDAEKANSELLTLAGTNNPLIEKKQLELNNKTLLVDSLKSAVKRGAYDGFDKRLDALGNVAEKSKSISMASIFIMLLFLAIELAPVLVKLISTRGPYDDLLEKHEHEFEVFRKEKITLLNQSSGEKIEHALETGSYKNQREIEYDKEIVKHFKAAETEITLEKIQQWKKEEMSKSNPLKTKDNIWG